MKKKILLLSSALMLLMQPLSAQQLTVVKGQVDCGNVAYERPITALFELRNDSRDKIKIDKVETNCGCTSADYPRGEIECKQTFTVQLTYDARMLGRFRKSAYLSCTGSQQPVELVMKGIVLAELEENKADFPFAFGNLYADKNAVEFDNVNKGENQEMEISVYNNGSETIEPNLLHLPSYITTKVMPERLSPGKAGTVTLYLNSSKLRDYGLTQTTVYLASHYGDKVSDEIEIPISVVLTPDLVDLTEAEKLNAPQLSLSEEKIDIHFDGKAKKRHNVIITNTGRSTLNITSLQLFTRGMKVTLPKRQLQPGESTKLKITAFRNELSKVRTKPRVLMITNDPQRSKVVIELLLTPNS